MSLTIALFFAIITGNTIFFLNVAVFYYLEIIKLLALFKNKSLIGKNFCICVLPAG